MAKKAETTKKAGSSLMSRLIILALIAFIGWQLYGLQGQLTAAQAERDRYQTEVETLRQENDALAADIAEGTTQEKMEEIARKELGVVTPGEYVFSHRGN